MCSTRSGLRASAGRERYEVPASFLEEERKALPARVYRQEYFNSFEDTDDQVFSHADVQAAISEEVTPFFEAKLANG